jgi:C-terminal processing protease CtpA/Prc
MYDKYSDWALHTRERRDFYDVIRMMMGELNSSHLGVWKITPGGETTGMIGVVADPVHIGPGIKVKSVIPNSPAAELKTAIKPGEIITHINGEQVETGMNLFALTRNMAQQDIILTVSKGTRTRDVKISPVPPRSIIGTVKDNWIAANQESVHDKSDRRIGYLYIASMYEPNLRKFEKDLYEEMDKEGLIIDIRYNGGGHIHDAILDILRRTAYAYSIERGGQKTYSSLFKWNKPTVVLINEHCYSNAEIFPAAFKALELGKLVGTPTFGAVIGTIDIKLHDGTNFRVPGTGWYMLDGVNLENTPVEPDIYAENPPEADGSSNDPQLSKAVEVLMAQIGQ